MRSGRVIFVASLLAAIVWQTVLPCSCLLCHLPQSLITTKPSSKDRCCHRECRDHQSPECRLKASPHSLGPCSCCTTPFKPLESKPCRRLVVGAGESSTYQLETIYNQHEWAALIVVWLAPVPVNCPGNWTTKQHPCHQIGFGCANSVRLQV